MKGNRTITEVILSLNILISFCQVSHPPFKNPGSATENTCVGMRNRTDMDHPFERLKCSKTFWRNFFQYDIQGILIKAGPISIPILEIIDIWFRYSRAARYIPSPKMVVYMKRSPFKQLCSCIESMFELFCHA